MMMDAIYYGRDNKWYFLFGFVVMPDHTHLLISPREKKVPGIMRGLKGYTARIINDQTNTIGPMWQEGHIDFPINIRGMAEQKLVYIEKNPVRAKLVKSAEDYLFSSAGRHDKLDLHMMRSLFE